MSSHFSLTPGLQVVTGICLHGSKTELNMKETKVDKSPTDLLAPPWPSRQGVESAQEGVGTALIPFVRALLAVGGLADILVDG